MGADPESDMEKENKVKERKLRDVVILTEVRRTCGHLVSGSAPARGLTPGNTHKTHTAHCTHERNDRLAECSFLHHAKETKDGKEMTHTHTEAHTEVQ